MSDDFDNYINTAYNEGYRDAIGLIKMDIEKLRKKKATNMTSDYAWALEDIDKILQNMEGKKS